MSILAAGGNIGLMLGLLIGGWVNEWYGWRAAFFVAAVPGAMLALLIAFTVKEPARELKAQRQRWVSETWQGLLLIGKIPSMRRFVVGGSLYGMAAYGIHTWMPVYYIRFHGMTTGESGTVNALMVGVLGAFGAIIGGMVCGRLSKRDIRWHAWIPAIGISVSLPLLIAMLLTDNTTLAIALFIIPGLLSSVFAGPTWSMIQELVPVGRRAMAAAVFLLLFNLVGLGLGPFAVGVLSDLYAMRIGDESLRWAMCTVLLIGIGGVVAYLKAGSSLRSDLSAESA
jgi:MFS family permease